MIIKGPTVGERESSDNITREYAKSDRIYVEKTIDLTRTYSQYRRIMGDGNCGWRAIGFAYCESLVESGDLEKIHGEMVRLGSLNPKLGTVGGYPYYEDWADEMMELLRELARAVEANEDAHAVNIQRWNDNGVEGSLIYYLRLLAATYLKANPDAYLPFIPDGLSLDTYCGQTIELPGREIENIGIVALSNVLLAPAQLSLEIAYLDRSPGSRVNHHRFGHDTDGKEASLPGHTIHLLYRPDHYDILYRAPEIVHPPADLLIQRLSNMSHNLHIADTSSSLGTYSSLDYSALPMIPGLTGVPNLSPLTSRPAPVSAVSGEHFSPAQQGSWGPIFSEDDHSHSRQASLVAQAQSPAPSNLLGSISSPLMPSGLTVDARKPSPLVQTAGEPSAAGYPIRFSPVQLDYEESKNAFRESSFQVKTNTFKNSIWNRAHYGNPDFHPEEWSPDDESTDTRAGAKRRGKRE